MMMRAGLMMREERAVVARALTATAVASMEGVDERG
jgi:hypothetical protein